MRNQIFLLWLFACLYSHLSCAATDEDDIKFAKSFKAATPADTPSIHLDLKSQQLAGIKTQALETVQKQPEFIAYGVVLSLEPLLKLRQQFLAVQAQQNSAKARSTEAYLNLSRTQDLHYHEIVSTRRLQEQQAQWQSDKAGLDATGYQQQTILTAGRLEWGEILTDSVVLRQNKLAEQFLNHGAQLLQLTLPANTHLNPDIRTVYIDEHGQRNTAIKAQLISISPKIDPVSQGECYFFKTAGRQIPYGTHITAWIAIDTKQVAGVIIPDSALVWYLGQAFVFVKTSEDQFIRRALAKYTQDRIGYFVTENIRAKEEVVTIGTQTLLSEQLKTLIPSEDKE